MTDYQKEIYEMMQDGWEIITCKSVSHLKKENYESIKIKIATRQAVCRMKDVKREIIGDLTYRYYI